MPTSGDLHTSAFNLSRRLIAVSALLIALSPAPALGSPCGDAMPVAAIDHHTAGPLSPGAAHRFRVDVTTTGILGFAVQTPIDGPQTRLALLDCESGEATTIESFEQARTVAVRRPGTIGFEVTTDSAITGYQIRTGFVSASNVGPRVDLRILDPAEALFPTQLPGEPQAIGIELLAPSHGHGTVPIQLGFGGDHHEDATDDLEIDVLLTPPSAGDGRVLRLDVGRPGVLLTAPRFAGGTGDSTSGTPGPRWLAAVRPGEYLVTIGDSAIGALHFELLDLCGPGQLDPDASPACATTMTPGTMSLQELENTWPADVDSFSFLTTAKKTVTLATLDGLDTLGALYDGAGRRLAFDSGDGSGFVIRQVLEPGIYFLRVEGQAGVTGAYRPVLVIAPAK